jgi:GT2 family glycosyltransferase
MKFSVCIGSARPATLPAAVDGIRRQSWPDWELTVVGQGPDPTLRSVGEAIAAQDSRIRYIHLARLGVSEARNVAVAASGGDLIAITDDDCVAQADWLETLAGYFTAAPEIGLVGGALIAPNATGRRLADCPQYHPPEALYDPVASRRVAPPGWSWLTANVAFRRRVFEEAGPFDEAFGPGAIFRVVTDLDYLFRLEGMGVRMRSTPKSVVVHASGYRYGFAALLRRAIDYAWGHGALAAKLTLGNDPRGQAWHEAVRRRWRRDPIRRRRPEAVALELVRLWNFTRAYRYCLSHYRLGARGVLEPIEAIETAPSPAVSGA